MGYPGHILSTVRVACTFCNYSMHTIYVIHSRFSVVRDRLPGVAHNSSDLRFVLGPDWQTLRNTQFQSRGQTTLETLTMPLG